MKKVFFLIIIGFLFACANPNIGKQFPLANYPSLTGSNHHFVTLKHFVLDYDYSINSVENTITFDGRIKFRMEEFDSALWEVTNIRLEIYFLDRDRKCINVEYLNLLPEKYIDRPILFKKKFPYDPKYYFITFGYRAETLMTI